MSATEKPFEREPRYLVIKVNDALAHLSSSEIYALGEMGEKITNGRSSAGKLPLVTVVVEQDWPEFELVWEMIKARVTGKGNDARRVVACLNACKGISTENLEDNLPVLELAHRYNDLLKQQRELLTVIKNVLDGVNLEVPEGSTLEDSDGVQSSRLVNVFDLIRCADVVARVEGGAV